MHPDLKESYMDFALRLKKFLGLKKLRSVEAGINGKAKQS